MKSTVTLQNGACKFIYCFLILLVIGSSCSKDSAISPDQSIIGSWQEQKVSGMHEQFTFTFNKDGSGRMDAHSFYDTVHPDVTGNFTYTVKYDVHRLLITWEEGINEEDFNDVFTLTDGYILRFGEFTLYKL